MDFYVAFRTAQDWMQNHPGDCPVPAPLSSRRAAYERAWAENFAFELCTREPGDRLFTPEEMAEVVAGLKTPTPAHLDQVERDLDAIARERSGVLAG